MCRNRRLCIHIGSSLGLAIKSFLLLHSYLCCTHWEGMSQDYPRAHKMANGSSSFNFLSKCLHFLKGDISRTKMLTGKHLSTIPLVSLYSIGPYDLLYILCKNIFLWFLAKLKLNLFLNTSQLFATCLANLLSIKRIIYIVFKVAYLNRNLFQNEHIMMTLCYTHPAHVRQPVFFSLVYKSMSNETCCFVGIKVGVINSFWSNCRDFLWKAWK